MPLNINAWWIDRPNEIYWLEVTGRTDFGVNLKAPQVNEHGNEFWSYSLLKYVNPGNIIFHYDRTKQSIFSQSVVTGELWEDNITWAARGTYARQAGIQPHLRLGWYVGLENYRLLTTPLNLDMIRILEKEITKEKHKLMDAVGGSIYFPFEISIVRPIRPMQGYIFKLPMFFVELFRETLGDYLKIDYALEGKINKVPGVLYRVADEDASVADRDPFAIDPAIVERGIRGHAYTQNRLANFLKTKNIFPLSPGIDEPNYDIGWVINNEMWVAEVKSITNTNEEKQLRLGLGQVLRYVQLFSLKRPSKGVLVIEKPPSDYSWVDLCKEHNVLLAWPEIFYEVFIF